MKMKTHGRKCAIMKNDDENSKRKVIDSCVQTRCYTQ